MKNLLTVLFFAFFLMTIISCGDDDDGMTGCTQSDWVGTYEGTVDCDGETEDVVVTVMSSGTEDVIILYETPTVEAEYDPLTPDGCEILESVSDAGLTLTVDIRVNGDEFFLYEEWAGDTESIYCDLSATRQ